MSHSFSNTIPNPNDAERLSSTNRPELGTGGDLLAAIVRGQLPPPPAATLLGLELNHVGAGVTRFAFTARPEIGNPDHAHGGILAAIVDFAVATAVWTATPAHARIVTADLHVSFLRSIDLDGAGYMCEGRLTHLGRSQANATAEIRDSEGVVYALGMATCRVLDRSVTEGSSG